MDWLPDNERGFYESVVHGLRSKGWSRLDAESEALGRLVVLRERRIGTPARIDDQGKGVMPVSWRNDDG